MTAILTLPAFAVLIAIAAKIIVLIGLVGKLIF